MKKICSRCYHVKSSSDFRPRGLQCKECEASLARERRQLLSNRTDLELMEIRSKVISKKCTKCKKNQSSEHFPLNRSRVDGYDSVCRGCRNNGKRNRLSPSAEEKVCWGCNRKLSLSCFYNNSSKADGKESRCKSCRLVYRQNNPDRVKVYNAKRRIQKRGSLTKFDMKLSLARRQAISSDPCYYCSDENADFYDIDHYFPISKGGDDSWYNLVRACKTCNASKHDKCGTRFMLMKI